MRAFLIVTFWLGSYAGAIAADSAVTELVTDRCKVAARETKDEAGVPLTKAERYASAWRCNGQGGLYVYIRYGDQREDIAFGNKLKVTTEYVGHGHFGSWGPSVEWRGAKAKNGRFLPVAAIVLYRWDIRNGENTNVTDVGGDLAIIRLGKARTDTCVVAWVDTVANSDAMSLARKAADEKSQSYDCSKAPPPQYIGKPSRRDQQ